MANGQSSCEIRGPRELRSGPISGHLYPGASTQRFDRAEETLTCTRLSSTVHPPKSDW